MQEPPISQDTPPISIQSIGVFGLLTAVFLITFITLTNRLSQYPRYVPDNTSLIPRQWVVVTNHEQTFTFDMPVEWEWHEHQVNAPDHSFESVLTENSGVETAVSLFRRIDPQTEITLIAIAESDQPHPPFLFVAQSKRMKQLSPTQLAAAVSTEFSDLQRIELVDHPGRQQSVEFILELPIYSDAWQCLYQYTNNDDAGYVLGSCAPRNNFGSVGSDLQAIQDSFQLLFR